MANEVNRPTKYEGLVAYGALKRYGFSAFKAAEIALDYQRGDAYASKFVSLAMGWVPSSDASA